MGHCAWKKRRCAGRGEGQEARLVARVVLDVGREQGEPVRFVDLPTPGLLLLSTAPVAVCRCLYRATNGTLYGIYGANVSATVGGTGSLTLSGTGGAGSGNNKGVDSRQTHDGDAHLKHGCRTAAGSRDRDWRGYGAGGE